MKRGDYYLIEGLNPSLRCLMKLCGCFYAAEKRCGAQRVAELKSFLMTHLKPDSPRAVIKESGVKERMRKMIKAEFLMLN